MSRQSKDASFYKQIAGGEKTSSAPACYVAVPINAIRMALWCAQDHLYNADLSDGEYQKLKDAIDDIKSYLSKAT